MKQYDHISIEKKWQKKWESKKPNKAKEQDEKITKKKKFYALIEFPYPSGDGLHVGHIRSNTAMDIISRKRRREGFNVLYPIGWDAFGLPAENYAIKTGIQPSIITKKNSATFRRQLKALGFSFDWSREIDTTDPKYYKWTQWIFLQFLKKGLAYKKKMTINWCPKDLIGLANEEVIDGCCERCGTKVEKKEKEQWMLAITKYADRLDKDLDETEFLEKIKIQQRNWIGKSEGAEIDFALNNNDKKIKVFTTRPDTLYGVTYIVLTPEHAYVHELISKASNKVEIENYIAEVKGKTEIERTAEEKEKTGVEIKGIKAINPITKEEIPVYVADYVLADYGTGAVMAVPAHDERDYKFAKKYGLEIKQVIAPVMRSSAGGDAVKPELPFKDRDAVVCIVKHWSKDEYLCLQWKEFPDIRSFVTGGIEAGENLVDTGIREIKEETGYINPKFIRQDGLTNFVEFYHQIKKTNVRAKFRHLYFELEDGEQVNIAEEENKKHTIIWKPKEEVYSFLSLLEKDGIWKSFTGEKESTYVDEGLLIESGEFNGRNSSEIKKEITEASGGKWVTKFKLRDWIFSRQRYWGEPIPVVHCEKCGIVPLPEKELPLKLPKVKNYKPTETGESPLASISKWVNTKCPTCKGKAKRETDTMPNWAGSSWYYLRYTDPKNSKAFADKKNLEYWTPVDWYNGGMEHTTLHLLYSRFWHKFLFDLGYVPTSEPYKKRTSHGLILAEGGEKMSKSKGNVINPDDIIKVVGADALRVHEMFMGPFDQAIAWDTNAIAGSRRFIERVWKLQEKISTDKNFRDSEKIEVLINKTIKKVSDDIEEMKFNTAISAMMIVVNEFEKETNISKENYSNLIKLVAPFAPHVAEEIWTILKNKDSVHSDPWPKPDESKLKESTVTISIQINGKMRGSMETAIDLPDQEVQNMALDKPEIKKWLENMTVKKVIVIRNRLINIVV